MTGSESCREEKRTELFIIEKIRIFQNQLVIDLILTYGIAYFKIYCCISSMKTKATVARIADDISAPSTSVIVLLRSEP